MSLDLNRDEIISIINNLEGNMIMRQRKLDDHMESLKGAMLSADMDRTEILSRNLAWSIGEFKKDTRLVNKLKDEVYPKHRDPIEILLGLAV